MVSRKINLKYIRRFNLDMVDSKTLDEISNLLASSDKLYEYTNSKLKSNQFLIKEEDLEKDNGLYLDDALLGHKCIGFTDGERDESLDGEYVKLISYNKDYTNLGDEKEK